MKDIMLDIETMGCSENAVMIQLAAVRFNRYTGETGGEFCMSITPESCKNYGFVEDQSTVDWWAKQNQDVLKGILDEAVHVKEVVQQFNGFLQPHKETIVWSHATFDFVIVQNYLKKLSTQYMNYKKARDIRTLVDLSGIDLKKYDWDKGKTHNALDDCKFQIEYCVDAFKILRSRGATPR